MATSYNNSISLALHNVRYNGDVFKHSSSWLFNLVYKIVYRAQYVGNVV